MSTPTSPVPNWEAVKQRVMESLHVTTIDSQWDGLCSASAKDAAVEIRRIFIMKGYAASRLVTWDDYEWYATRLATWFAITRGVVLGGYDLKALEWLDPRKELTEASALIIDGVATAPAINESDVGGIATGTITGVSDMHTNMSCRQDIWGQGWTG